MQLAKYGEDVQQFEAARLVPSILLFLLLQLDDTQNQRAAGGGRYKRLMDDLGARFSVWQHLDLSVLHGRRAKRTTQPRSKLRAD